MRERLLRLLLALSLLLAVRPATAQEPPATDPNTDLVNTLLSGLLGFPDRTGRELQEEVAVVGGVPFRSDVPVDFMSRPDLARYLREVLDDEYPEARARIDQRTLV